PPPRSPPFPYTTLFRSPLPVEARSCLVLRPRRGPPAPGHRAHDAPRLQRVGPHGDRAVRAVGRRGGPVASKAGLEPSDTRTLAGSGFDPPHRNKIVTSIAVPAGPTPIPWSLECRPLVVPARAQACFPRSERAWPQRSSWPAP